MSNGIFELKKYGRVVIVLKEIMDRQGITRNHLARLTGLVYNSINRYYQNTPISSVDLDVLAKICYVMNCDISDVLKYEQPKLGVKPIEEIDVAEKKQKPKPKS